MHAAESWQGEGQWEGQGEREQEDTRNVEWIQYTGMYCQDLRGSPSAISIAVIPRDHWSLCTCVHSASIIYKDMYSVTYKELKGTTYVMRGYKLH